MSMQALNPPQVGEPLGPYSQGILTGGSGQWLHIAGQVGVRPDGSVAEGFSEQADIAWSNIQEILRTAGMTVAHLVKVVTYITDEAELSLLGPVRLKYLGDARPASTLIVAKALARPEWKVEVDVVAFMSLPGEI
ncbi:RidA family protein [Paralcaligenes sp. KSB-10]|uniref:RidA family protein n=1 Tax=Paralcaligenes sp. KSB-10 TaxID=2901142 RepID=UPI001E5F312D|nr:RidA family protein [Paralcaligenes sp. KSB-10]UHL64696.1 RidA family protein [Paralcaligenes sp. KSB-10]